VLELVRFAFKFFPGAIYTHKLKTYPSMQRFI